jgi:hypothetical protein
MALEARYNENMLFIGMCLESISIFQHDVTNQYHYFLYNRIRNSYVHEDPMFHNIYSDDAQSWARNVIVSSFFFSRQQHIGNLIL